MQENSASSLLQALLLIRNGSVASGADKGTPNRHRAGSSGAYAPLALQLNALRSFALIDCVLCLAIY